MGQTVKTLGKNQSGVALSKTDYLVKGEKVGFFEKLVGGDIEFNRYGIITILLLWNVILAGVTVGLGAMTNYWQLAIVAVSTLALLTWILAVQPMKVILTIAIVGTVLDILFIAYNLMA